MPEFPGPANRRPPGVLNWPAGICGMGFCAYRAWAWAWIGLAAPNANPSTVRSNQLFGTFVGGVVYLVQCYAGDTSDGQELSIWALWPCQIPGQAAPVPPPPTGRYSY